MNLSTQSLITVVILLGASVLCPPVRGEVPDLAIRINALRNTVIEQQAELDRQQEQIASQLVLIDELQAALSARAVRAADQKSNNLPALGDAESETPRVKEPVDSDAVGSTASDGQRAAVAELQRREIEGIADSQVDSQQTLYDPSNSIFDPNFPGAWHMPGTTAAMKIGGYVNLAVVNSLDPLLASDRFIVGSIPPSGQVDSDARRGTAVTANQTRFNIEVRQHTDGGQLRAFVEGDFLGELPDADSFRLRHAYGQYRSFLAGQTWSALSNQEALPEQVDFEGINGAVLVRQPQIQFFPSVGKDLHLVMSLENPATDIDGGTGQSELPDLVLSVNRLPFTSSHVWNYKVGMIVRELKGSTDLPSGNTVQKTTGWGLTTSGRIPSPVWGESDGIAWQFTYGRGVGRYLNDLNTVGGGDAVFDPNGKLEPLPVFAGFLSYQHEWENSWMNRLPGLWRSNLNFSWIDVSNYDFQEDGSYNQTLYTSANLIYFPTQSARVGLEFLWGQRKNKDSTQGTARQIQLSTRFTF